MQDNPSTPDGDCQLPLPIMNVHSLQTNRMVKMVPETKGNAKIQSKRAGGISTAGDDGRKAGFTNEPFDGIRTSPSVLQTALASSNLNERSYHNYFSSAFPYIRADYSHEPALNDWLTREIEDFTLFFAPLEDEILARNSAVRLVVANLRAFAPNSRIAMFGSSATTLYFPDADVDLVMCTEKGDFLMPGPIYQLKDFLERAGIGRNFDLRNSKSNVQVITFTELTSNLGFDITFERPYSVRASARIREWTVAYRELRPLLMVIKKYLAAHKWDKVYNGGLSSYSVTCMIVNMLKKRRMIYGQESLGTLLIRFFELYGDTFNYFGYALNMRNNMGYLDLNTHPHLRSFTATKQPGLAIEDPDDSSNNISAGSFKYDKIRSDMKAKFTTYISQGEKLAMPGMETTRRGLSLLSMFVKTPGFGREFSDDVGRVPPVYLELDIIPWNR